MLLEILFWSLAAFLMFTFAGYPLLVFLASRFVEPWEKPHGTRGEDHLPTVTIIVAAYNEEDVITRKIENCLELDYPEERLGTLIVSDGSKDGTVDLARKYEGDRVRIIDYPENRGKNKTLNGAMKHVDTGISVISDASVLLDREALRTLASRFSDATVGGVWGKKIYRNVSGTAGGEGESIYLKYGNFIKSCESRLGTIVSAEGSLFAFRTELFENLPQGVADDFILSTILIRKEKRIEYAEDALSYEETSPTDSGEFRRKSRIIQQAVKGIYLSRDLLNPLKTGFYALQLLTVKVFRRLASPALFLLFVQAAVLSGTSPVYMTVFYLGLFFTALAAAGWLLPPALARLPVFSVPFYIFMVNLAVANGFIGFLTGREVARWEPTERIQDAGQRAGRFQR